MVLAVPGLAVPEVTEVTEVTEAHAAALAGKVVIDAANRFDGGPFNNFPAVHAVGGRCVRAFSAEDDEARTIAAQLIRDVGLRPVFVPSADRTAEAPQAPAPCLSPRG